MVPIPVDIKIFHIFVAAPGDMEAERKQVREYFEEWNRTDGAERGTRLEVINWEDYYIEGLGRQQERITQSTLEEYLESLILVIGLLGERLGTPTGTSESGTKEEIEWALKRREKAHLPEIKLFALALHCL